MDVAVSAQQWPSAYLLTRYRPASISAGAVMPTACHAFFVYSFLRRAMTAFLRCREGIGCVNRNRWFCQSF